MSKKAGYGGAGGYGGISTMDQRDVRPRYEPHLAISKRVDHAADAVILKCLDCGQEWTHTRGFPNCPAICKKERR